MVYFKMKKTLLFGGSGFFGPVILSKNPDIISVGRTKPPIECKNKLFIPPITTPN